MWLVGPSSPLVCTVAIHLVKSPKRSHKVRHIVDIMCRLLVSYLCVADGGDDKGDKNRKKTPKANKKKEKPAGQEGVAAASTSTAAGAEPVVASGANEKRAKGSDAAVSKGASTRGSEGNKEKGAGKERTDKSPRARGAGAAAGGKSSQKPQPEFNMESDFPTLVIHIIKLLLLLLLLLLYH
jgi:cobalamin biosynthesis Mg chelatase CobN